jgi:hippurate hydrolase
MFTTADADAVAPDLVALRHALHRRPELGLDLPETQARVLEALAGLPLEVSVGKELSSVTAVLRGGSPGPVVLLRADMDALPVVEESGVPYASETPGVMHACGHDVHTAALVGAARLLAERRSELRGDVVLMFQPGEEGGAGARRMIEEGVLEAAGAPVVAAYAFHAAGNVLPVGHVATRPGPLMAASDTAEVTIRGVGGHGSNPVKAKDPVPALCALVGALQTMVTREVDVFDPAVITVGRLEAGTASNVIPDSASLSATVRTFSPSSREQVLAAIERVVHATAAAYGVEAEVVFADDGYPVTVNDAAETEFALDVARRLLDPEAVHLAPTPLAGAEDFSYVLQQVPGSYLYVGAVPAGVDPDLAPANHSARVVFDDGAVTIGAALLAELAAQRMAAGDEEAGQA